MSTFDFTTLSLEAEGVTILPDGTVYVVAESSVAFGGAPTLFRLSAVPEPSTLALLTASAALVVVRRRSRLTA